MFQLSVSHWPPGAFFSDGTSDYFGIAGQLDPAPRLRSYKNVDGSDLEAPYLVGEDLNGEGCSLPITCKWANIDISNVRAFDFKVAFGATSNKIDVAESIVWKYSVDSG